MKNLTSRFVLSAVVSLGWIGTMVRESYGQTRNHNVMLKVGYAERERLSFASLVSTLEISVRENEFFKFYEVIIWEETASVHFYEFPNDFNPRYGWVIDSVDRDGFPLGMSRNDNISTRQIIAYREGFLIRKYPDMPDAINGERSTFLKLAFMDIASILVERHPGSEHHLKFNGHGSPGGRLFQGYLEANDANQFLESWSNSLDRPLGAIDMGGPCNKGSFADLDNYCSSTRYYIASDLLNGGYAMDEFTWAKYDEVRPLRQYHNLFSDNENLEGALKARIDLKRKDYEYSRENMIADGVAQANYLYSCEAFQRFSTDFESFLLNTGVDYRFYDDLYTYMVNNNAPSSLLEQFNDVIEYRVDNKDFFVWSENRNGMLMPDPGLLQRLEESRPRPFALKFISGDGQRGVSGNALDQPLIVEVLDQFGNLLPDAAVTFTVTAGEGKLSGRFAVQHTTTDANGRAALPFTLGPYAGPNTVVVSVGGRILGTFTAEGVATTVAELEGDYLTWHLPTPATLRLGKGAMGEGDRPVALSADGRCLAVASGIGVWLYETATSRALALLPSEWAVHSVAFSHDGQLASGLDNGLVVLWEVETGERTGTLRRANRGRVTAVAFSPEGTHLASGSWDQNITLWDVAARREIGAWVVPRDDNSVWPLSVSFAPDGRRLASGFQDGTIRLWDVATGTEVAMLGRHTDRVSSVSFSPDGSRLASAGAWRDPTVRLWNIETRTEIATLKGHAGAISSVVFSPLDGATLASGSLDRTVRLWDLAKYEEVATVEELGDGVVTVAYSPDGTNLVSGAIDGTVLFRDLETGNAAGLSGHGILSSMALSSDGVTVAMGYHDGTVRLWDVARKARIATLEGHTAGVGTVSFSYDGETLASGSRDRTVRLWDVKSGEPAGMLEGHNSAVTSVSFSPDGATVASAGGSKDATVRLWDVSTRVATGILEGHTSNVRSVSFSSDGTLLASAGGYEDRTVRIWNVATRELIGTLEGHTGSVDAVVFSPDDALLASGSQDGVTLWDVGTRQRMSSLNKRRSVNSLAFSADGTTLAAGTWGGATLWDLTTREEIVSLAGHTHTVHSVAFSNDGNVLATGAPDGTMLLWNSAEYLAPSNPNPDFDGDGTVGFDDFVQFAAQFGSRRGDDEYDARYDLDGNGTIGFSDFVIFSDAFGTSAAVNRRIRIWRKEEHKKEIATPDVEGRVIRRDPSQ